MTRVTVTHNFAASAERVYAAWLDPQTIRRFLFTTATGEIVRCDVDARVGGRYAIVDRRHGEDVLHEGVYLELDRPRRIVFTLRVPKYSADEDRVTIEIAPLADGCLLTLTTATADAWAEDTERGWTMILDVLDATLPGSTPTCGAGIAQHAAVPRHVAAYFAALAETLELHRTMLLLDEEPARKEDAAYADLARSYRELAAKTQDAAELMIRQRDLPMAAHDERQWTERHARAFARFVHEQGALTSILRVAAVRDEQMLASMQPKPD